MLLLLLLLLLFWNIRWLHTVTFCRQKTVTRSHLKIQAHIPNIPNQMRKIRDDRTKAKPVPKQNVVTNPGSFVKPTLEHGLIM